MRVRVAESNLVQDLVDFLRRCGCEVDQTSAGVVDVRLQPGIGPEWARMEVDEYLRVCA